MIAGFKDLVCFHPECKYCRGIQRVQLLLDFYGMGKYTNFFDFCVVVVIRSTLDKLFLNENCKKKSKYEKVNFILSLVIR